MDLVSNHQCYPIFLHYMFLEPTSLAHIVKQKKYEATKICSDYSRLSTQAVRFRLLAIVETANVWEYKFRSSQNAGEGEDCYLSLLTLGKFLVKTDLQENFREISAP